jgi:hypothetical protein
MNIQKITLVVEKSTREIFCYSLISKFKHIFIELFIIGCKREEEKKNILKVIHQYITQHINSGKSYKYNE